MKPIYLSSEDYNLLSKTVNGLIAGLTKVPPPIQKLQEELSRSIILHPAAIPANVVTLNSNVRLRDLKTGEIEEWVLTMPEHADPDQKRISVLAPIGTAVLGFAEGDEIEWDTPGGLRSLMIQKVEHGAFSVPDFSRSLYD